MEYTYSFFIWLLFSCSISSVVFCVLFASSIGYRGSEFIVLINSITIFFISFFLFIKSLKKSICFDYDIARWFDIGLLNSSFGIRLDSLTITMLVIVTTISLFAQTYSVEYMYYDPHKSRFFSYMSLFTFFMLILVCSNNLITLFIGWEGVGICSYLLINFWYFRSQANKSAILAVLANKIGDISLLIAIAFTQTFAKTVDFLIINTLSNICKYNDNIRALCISLDTYLTETGYYRLTKHFVEPELVDYINNLELTKLYDIIVISTLFFIIACVGKSAQFGLHIWLPEAMEGPTPVSSLIHAATMVTAGIYLILRCSTLFSIVPTSLSIILFMGSITTLFASSVGLTQVDLKKVVAYSTCSQLGYMFMGCGLNSYNLVIFHLFIHAFFKALLFLTAGYLIHFFGNEQDIRKMGGLLKMAPLPYIFMSIGSLSLIGFPFLSGFFSKEKIIEQLSLTIPVVTYEKYYILFQIAIFCSYTTLVLTILYSFQVLFWCFYGYFNGFKQILSIVSYSDWSIIGPLILLSMLSIYSGAIFNDAMIGNSSDFWGNSFFIEKYLIHEDLYDSSFKYNKQIKLECKTESSIIVCLFLDVDYLLKTYISKPIYYTTNISEFNWRNTQWVVPVWTLYYMLMVLISTAFLKRSTYRFVIGNNLITSLFQTINRKYIYINRLLIVPIITYFYTLSYLFFYLFIEKGFLESFGGYGIYKTFILFLTIKTKYRSFELYHYIGLLTTLLLCLSMYIVDLDIYSI